MVIKWMARLVGVALLLTGLMQVFAQEATVAPDATARTYRTPDANYTFTYPLDYYSVRQTLVGADNPNIIFPGALEIALNDSLIYRDGQGTIAKVTVAGMAVPDGTELDASLLGTGPLMQYAPDMIQPDQVQQIDLGGVPALRVDNVPVGQAGALTDMLAMYNGILYEITIEPVTTGAAGQVNGDDLLQSILDTFEFSEPTA